MSHREEPKLAFSKKKYLKIELKIEVKYHPFLTFTKKLEVD